MEIEVVKKVKSSTTVIEEWTRNLGAEYVITDSRALLAYGRNVSALHRDILAVLKPATVEEVHLVVTTANRFRTPLYPISCGKNWGYGSRLPSQSGCAIVDLGRMNRIREVNVDFHYAVVEPGVTQKQLYDYLIENRLPLIMDVTGSGSETSLLGNALERGIGYNNSRAEMILGMEVILGNGTKFRTGFGHFENAQATYLCKHGVGPSLDGLFSQSNFGIVTSAAIELYPKPENQCVMVARLNHPRLFVAMVNALAELRRSGIIKTVTHLANQNRMHSTLGPLLYKNLKINEKLSKEEALQVTQQILHQKPNPLWSAVTGIMGSKDQVQKACSKIRQTLKRIAEVTFVDGKSLERSHQITKKLSFSPNFKRQLTVIKAYQPLLGLAMGIPTDETLSSVAWPLDPEDLSSANDLDASHCGLLYCVPVSAMNGESALKVSQMTEQIISGYKFTPYITINFINTRALEMIINISFDRTSPSQVQLAHACMDELHDCLMEKGFFPYRAGLHAMKKILNEDDPFWQTVRDLKKVLDPNNIISPGRYNLI
jgi:4-cresol dehydrogenase (hydroxylating)